MYRAEFTAPAIGVDRKNRILRGYVIAQEGVTWHDDEFDLTTLQQIKDAIDHKPKGLKSRFTHPGMSNDGLGKYLGRTVNARIDQFEVHRREGPLVTVRAIRGDLHFDRTAFDIPPGGGKPLGEYVMDLAESDPDALSSSIVAMDWDWEYRLNQDGTRAKDETGNPLPPLFRVLHLHASDIVDTGAAVDGLFSAEFSDRLVYWRAAEMLDRVFSGQDPEVVRGRITAFVDRYLNLRTGDPQNKSEFSKPLLTGDETMEDNKPKAPGTPAPEPSKSAPPADDAAAREAALREEIRQEFSGQMNQLQERLDRSELEKTFASETFRRKVRPADERSSLVEMALVAKSVTRKVSWCGKEMSFYDAFLASVQARTDFIPEAKEMGADISDQLPGGRDMTADEALKKYAADNKLNIEEMEGFEKAERGAKQLYPDAFRRTEVN